MKYQEKMEVDYILIGTIVLYWIIAVIEILSRNNV